MNLLFKCKDLRLNQNKRFVFKEFFSFHFAIYEIMWEKCGTAGQATDETVWRMSIARWIPRATNTHSEYVTFIAFQLQQWLHEHTPPCYVIRTLPASLYSDTSSNE